MADRFPSIEDFSEGQTDIKPAGLEGIDADDDFLARERAALGDDAAQFTTSGDNAATAEDGEDDLLGGDFGVVQSSGQDASFESSFPAIDTANQQLGPGGTVTGTGQPYPASISYGNYSAPEDEPEVIKEWRERRALALEHRASTSTSKREATIKAAQISIDDFYENYNAKKDKSIAQARKEADDFLAKREDTSSGGTSWDRIARLVDLSGKGSKGGASGTGKERFRELLTSLRKDENAPGAAGV